MKPYSKKNKPLKNLIANAIQTKEQEHQLLIENLHVGVVVHAPDTRIILSNPEAVRVLGLSKKQMSGKEAADPAWHFVSEDGMRMSPDMYPVNRVLASGKPLKNLIAGVIQTKGKKPVWVLVNAYPQYDTSGSLQKVVVSFIDITDQKHAQEALIENEYLLSESQQMAHIGSWTLQIAENRLYWSPEMYRIYGVSPETFVLSAESFLKLIHPEDRPLMNAWIAACLAGDHPDHLEFRIVLSDGLIRYIDGRGNLQRNTQGHPHRIVGTAQDITDRKLSEEELLQNEARYRLFFETSIEAILLTAPDGRIFDANPEACRLFQRSVAELRRIGRAGVVDAMDPKLPEALRERAQKGQFRGELSFLKKDGTKIFGEISSVIFRDKDGREKTHMVIRDVTDRIKAEETIHRRMSEITALQKIGDAVSSSLSINKIAELTLDNLCEVIRPDMALFFTRNGQRLQLLSSTSPTGKFKHAQTPEHRVGECLCGIAASHREAVYSPDISVDMRCSWAECKEAGIRSFAALPLISENDVIGVLGLASAENRDFQMESAFLELLVHQISIATRNGMLHEQANHRVNELRAIYEASSHLVQLQKPDELAQTLVNVLEHVLGFEFGAVILVDEDGQNMTPFALSRQGKDEVFVQNDKEYVSSHKLQVGKGITGWVAQHGKSVCSGHVSADPRYLGLRDGIQSELCVPLKTADRTIGVINVETKRPNAYSASDQTVLETIAAQISIAIQNAHLLEEVQRHSIDLEHRVLERTNELQATNETLRQTMEELREMQLQLIQAGRMASVSQLIAGVAHEINNPLTFITGNLSFLRDCIEELKALQTRLEPETRKSCVLLSDELSEIALTVQKGTDRIQTIIQTLKVFGRFQESLKDEVNLHDSIDSSLHLLSSDFSKVTIHKQYGSIPRVECYPSLINQVIFNLLLNAMESVDESFKSGKKTSSLIVIRTEAITEHGTPMVRVSIQDTGSGIAKQLHEKIFDPFFTTKTVGKGLGLGLSVSYRIISMHKGNLYFTSNEDMTTFTFEIPTVLSIE